MQFLRTSHNEVINTNAVIRATWDNNPDEPPTVTLYFANGTCREFGYEEASAIWDIFTRDTPTLKGLVEIRQRQFEAQQERADVPF